MKSWPDILSSDSCGPPPTDSRRLMRGLGVPTICGLVVLCGFGLRVWRLDAQSLWWDEGFSLNLAGQSLSAIVRGDFHPPLYHLLLAGWVRLAGTSEFAARYLSVACGTLLIPLAYRVGCRLFDRATGYVAALLVAGSPVLLWYSQETRMYALVALIYLTLIWLFQRLTDPKAPPASSRLWIAFGILELAGLYTHYFIALGIAWLLLAILLRQTIHNSQFTIHNSQFTNPLFLTQALVALAYLPWLPVFLSLQARYNPIAATPPSLRTFFDQVWHGYNAGSLALVGHHAAFMTLSTTAGVLLAVGLAVALIRDPQRRNLVWLLGHTLVPLTAIFILMQIRPFFHPRYVVMLAPPLLIVVARVGTNIQYQIANAFSARVGGGVSGVRYGVFSIPLVFLLTFAVAIHGFTTAPRYQRDDLRGLAEHLARAAGPNDTIVFGYVDYPFRHYYAGPAPVEYLDLRRPDVAVAQTLAAGLQERQRAFLVSWNQAPVDRRGLLRWLLASAGRLVAVQPWGDLTVHTYALDRPVPRPALSPQTADFGVLRLLGTHLPASMPAAGAVPVAMAWTAPQRPLADYKAALRLRDRAGHEVAHADVLLVNRAGESTTHWTPGSEITNYAVLLLPRGTPPGVYDLDLVVYDAVGLRRLERQDVPGQRVQLGTVRLTATELPFEATRLPGFTPVDAAMAGLILEGYALDRAEVGPGGRLSVALRWQVADAPVDVVPRLGLIAGGTLLAEADAPLYPASEWRPGQVILDWRDLVVPPDAPAHLAVLQVRAGTEAYPLAEITISAVDRRFEVPPMTYSMETRFGDVAELVGFDLDTAGRADAPVELTLYWRALAASDISYSVFTHLLNEEGAVVGQHDGVPAHGQRPTTGWIEAEIIVDPHPMTLKDATYTGIARVEIGLYDPVTGRRLTTAEGVDHVILPASVKLRP